MIKIVKEHIGFHYLPSKYSYILWFFPQYIYIYIYIYGIQDNESIMCGFCCIAFIESMLAGKTSLDYTNLFSPNDYKKNDKIICKNFKDKYGRRSESWV